jgi:hypothetical protein
MAQSKWKSRASSLIGVLLSLVVVGFAVDALEKNIYNVTSDLEAYFSSLKANDPTEVCTTPEILKPVASKQKEDVKTDAAIKDTSAASKATNSKPTQPAFLDDRFLDSSLFDGSLFDGSLFDGSMFDGSLFDNIIPDVPSDAPIEVEEPALEPEEIKVQEAAKPAAEEESTFSWLYRRALFHTGFQKDTDLKPSAGELWSPKHASVANPDGTNSLAHPLTACTATKLARFFLHQEFDPLVFDDSYDFAKKYPELHLDTQTLYGAVLFNDAKLIERATESLNIQTELLISSKTSVAIAREAIDSQAHPFTVAILFLLPLRAAHYTSAYEVLQNSITYGTNLPAGIRKALLYLASLRDIVKSTECIDESTWLNTVLPTPNWKIRNILGHYVLRFDTGLISSNMEMTPMTMAMQIIAASDATAATIRNSTSAGSLATMVRKTLMSMFAASDEHTMTPAGSTGSLSSLSSALNIFNKHRSISAAGYFKMITGEFGFTQWTVSQDNRQFVCSSNIKFSDIKDLISEDISYQFIWGSPNFPDFLAFQTTISHNHEVHWRSISNQIRVDEKDYLLRAVTTTYRNKKAVIVYHAPTGIWSLLTAKGAVDVPAYLAHTYIADRSTELFVYERI